MHLTLAEIFSRAATHITTYGHAKGDYCAADTDEFGRPRYASTPHELRPTCLVGAIQTVCTGQPGWTNELSGAAIQFASERMDGEPPFDEETGEPDYVEHIAAWNDDPARTKPEAVARLWRLAAEARMTMPLEMAA